MVRPALPSFNFHNSKGGTPHVEKEGDYLRQAINHPAFNYSNVIPAAASNHPASWAAASNTNTAPTAASNTNTTPTAANDLY